MAAASPWRPTGCDCECPCKGVPIPGTFVVRAHGVGPECVFPPDQPDVNTWFVSLGLKNDVDYVLHRVRPPLVDALGDPIDVSPCVACYRLGDLTIADIYASDPAFDTGPPAPPSDEPMWKFDDINFGTGPGTGREQRGWRAINLCVNFDPDSFYFGKFCWNVQFFEALSDPFSTPVWLLRWYATTYTGTVANQYNPVTGAGDLVAYEELQQFCAVTSPFSNSFDPGGRPPWTWSETDGGDGACYFDPGPYPDSSVTITSG